MRMSFEKQDDDDDLFEAWINFATWLIITGIILLAVIYLETS